MLLLQTKQGAHHILLPKRLPLTRGSCSSSSVQQTLALQSLTTCLPAWRVLQPTQADQVATGCLFG
jgi:hypothetical protein